MSLIADFVKELRDYAIYLEDDLGNGKTCDLLRKSADTIEELSTKVARQNMEQSSQYYNGGWIPCNECLPKKTESYIVTTYSSGLGAYIADIDHFIHSDCEPDGGYWVNCEDNKEVIAWQPLPPAFDPKED